MLSMSLFEIQSRKASTTVGASRMGCRTSFALQGAWVTRREPEITSPFVSNRSWVSRRVTHAPYKAEEERHPIREAPTIILGFLPCISNNDMDSIAFPKGRLPARS